MKTIEVVAALLCRPPCFLICRRPAHKARAGLYEFPGGKVETGETPQEALQRECREELGIETRIHEAVADVTHAYPDLTIHLTLYAVTIPQGEPQPLEHDDLCWITASQLDDYPFCPADVAFHEMIRSFMNQ
ncbi:MAG: (deoxy)nucleoside triphosphate pyrophosphohydrolase [Clostridiales bacterium]|nr:(deoxy)nucleoside triphosphate pyrophosphohydrolase [Clostridiales bacterium]